MPDFGERAAIYAHNALSPLQWRLYWPAYRETTVAGRVALKTLAIDAIGGQSFPNIPLTFAGLTAARPRSVYVTIADDTWDGLYAGVALNELPAKLRFRRGGEWIRWAMTRATGLGGGVSRASPPSQAADIAAPAWTLTVSITATSSPGANTVTDWEEAIVDLDPDAETPAGIWAGIADVGSDVSADAALDAESGNVATENAEIVTPWRAGAIANSPIEWRGRVWRVTNVASADRRRTMVLTLERTVRS